MLNITVSLNSKNRKIFCLLCAFCAVAAIYLFCGGFLVSQNGKTNEKRVEYISSVGISVASAPSEVKTVNIPLEFDDVYICYNSVQKKAGFDLLPFAGKQVTLYTYPLLKNDYVADVHLIVFKGEIIGGDICGRALGSEMLPLNRDSAMYFKGD